MLELTGRLRNDEVPQAIDELERPLTERARRRRCLPRLEHHRGGRRHRPAVAHGRRRAAEDDIAVHPGHRPRRAAAGGSGPGLVATIYSASKPRDRSHFEKFRTYHERLYAQVEPTSVTPFSPPVLDRALHAVLVAYVRQLGDAGRRAAAGAGRPASRRRASCLPRRVEQRRPGGAEQLRRRVRRARRAVAAMGADRLAAAGRRRGHPPAALRGEYADREAQRGSRGRCRPRCATSTPSAGPRSRTAYISDDEEDGLMSSGSGPPSAPRSPHSALGRCSSHPTALDARRRPRPLVRARGRGRDTETSTSTSSASRSGGSSGARREPLPRCRPTTVGTAARQRSPERQADRAVPPLPAVALLLAVQAPAELPLTATGPPEVPALPAAGQDSFLAQVPFVAMCEDGHLQDFPWREWVHRSANRRARGTLTPDRDRRRDAGQPDRQVRMRRPPDTVSDRRGRRRREQDVSEQHSRARQRQRVSVRRRIAAARNRAGTGVHRPLRGSLRSASNLYFGVVRSAIYLPRAGGGVAPELLAIVQHPDLIDIIMILHDAGQAVQPERLRRSRRKELEQLQGRRDRARRRTGDRSARRTSGRGRA